MPPLQEDDLRQALTTARRLGMTKVEIEGEGEKFSATLDWSEEGVEAAEEAALAPPPAPLKKKVTAPVVGYFRPGAKWVLGARVEQGESLGEILALGLTNDVCAPVAGTLVEAGAEEGDAVEYGQALGIVEGLA